ncbi:MOSC domain protein [Serinicoccus hydrothermalis]|uniref:MOSC domain protein n=1 Tax=Serinicoccus hydrothermalis TaxID=1758689 RepID=A0A1B1NC92_9MICO|nr:MOSC domain-containing protein [Serinicoccus hydrothermalis]ANS79048.1 MOSC domain protein [Serinicoccus hydrothermalis]
MGPRVVAVSKDEEHRFSKVPVERIEVLAGLGVVGDAHAGSKVQHRSRVRRDPTQPNVRQVHLVHAELFAEAERHGYALGPGDLGENVLTAGLDLLGLPTGTLLQIGEARLRLTGLRNPCAQINQFRPGLLKVVLAKEDGSPHDQPAPSTATPSATGSRLIRKAGVMAVVECSGEIRPGQEIGLSLPPGPHRPLEPV